jgi:hypothetical protein
VRFRKGDDMKLALKIISVIYIIAAVICFVIAILMLAGGLTLFTDVKDSLVIGVLYGLGAVVIIIGVLNFIIGMSGIKGCKGNIKSLNIGMILSGITIILVVASAIVGMVMYDIKDMSTYCYTAGQIIIPVIFTVLASNVKKEFTRLGSVGRKVN